jgi:hypothetical protein
VFIPLLKQTISSYLLSKLTPERSRELTGEVSRDITRKGAGVDKTAVLQRLRAMQEERLSLQAIAARLNKEGVPTLTGRGRWHKGTVGHLLA